MTVPAIGTGRAVEVLHDRGPATPPGGDRWTAGSGYLIGSGLVLTAAHNVDYRRDLGTDERFLVRTIEGNLLAARAVLVGDEMSRVDLALLEISDPRFGEQPLPVTFARVDRDSPAPVTGCWAVGFPRFGEAGPVLPGGSSRETWEVSGQILPGGKRRAGLLSLQVTSTPSAALVGSAWEGMSGAVVFAADTHDEQAAVGVISTHHQLEDESALTVVPVTAVAELPAAARWWRQFGVPDPGSLLILPRQRARAGPVRPTSAAGWPLTEVTDPFVLEVHRPVQPEDAPPGLPVLPPYVPREHDQLLGQVVRAAADGRSGIAVLVGGSSTGKTRACWEALDLLRDQDPTWRLWHPIDPSRPDAALAELPGIGPRTVVWLNEAQFYLDAEAELGDRVAAGLRERLRDPGRAPVLVLATMWPQFWDALTGRPVDGDDRHAQARELLAGHDITVPAAFTPAQMGQLAHAADARLVLAARSAPDGSVIQFLAGAPELLARYRNAPPAAAALIDAAMDARRLGMGASLPQAFLEAAAPGYLTDDQWDALGEDWPEQALAYTAVPAKGARGPLTRIRPRPGHAARDRGGQPGGTAAAAGPQYRLADYLDQHGRAHRASQIPPAEFWSAAAAHAAPGDQAALGDAADARGLYRDATQLHKNAAASGNARAADYLIHPAGTVILRADPRPAHWAAAHAPLDDPYAVARLLNLLRKAGADEQAAALLARDPAAHAPLDNPGAVATLLASLRDAGAREQAAALASRAAAHAPLDNPGAVADLLASLRKAGAREQAAALASRAAAHAPLDDPGAVAYLLDLLREAGAREQAAALLARDPAAHAPLDNPRAVADLLASLRKAGAREQAAALASRAAAHAPLDDPGAVAYLLYHLRDAGEQAAALLARDPAAHAAIDNPGGVAHLLDRLRETGAREQAAALASRAAAHAPLDDPGAVATLLDRLRDAGEQAAALLARDPAAHAAIDNPGGVAHLLDRLREAGAREQAAALASRAAAHAPLDDPGAVADLLASLRKAGAHEQAAALASRAAAHAPLDDPGAVADLLASLRKAGAHEQAAALASRAAAHAPLDNPDGVAYLLDRLRKAGAREQAAALASRAAAHAPLDDPGAVDGLLASLRDAGADEQAAALLARDPAAHAVLDDEAAVGNLLDRLLRTGAREQAAALAARLPAAGMFKLLLLAAQLPTADMFELFLGQSGLADRFRFGREADGTPAAPWGWEDLRLCLFLGCMAVGTGAALSRVLT